MTSSSRKKGFKKRCRNSAKTDNKTAQDLQLQQRLEFHRHAVALMPTDDDGDAAVAYALQRGQGRVGSLVCSCKASRSAT